MEYTEKDTKIKVSKNNISISNPSSSTNYNQTSNNENPNTANKVNSGTEITSPIIGTAYHAPEPGPKNLLK